MKPIALTLLFSLAMVPQAWCAGAVCVDGKCGDIAWTKTLDIKVINALGGKDTFALYFCLPDKPDKSAADPAPVVEDAEVADALKKAGIAPVLKIAAQPENAETFRMFGATLNSLMIIGPGGKKLASFEGDACKPERVLEYLKTYKSSIP